MTLKPRTTAPEPSSAAAVSDAASAPLTALPSAFGGLGRILPVERMEALPGRWVGGVVMILGPLLMLAEPARRSVPALVLALPVAAGGVYLGEASITPAGGRQDAAGVAALVLLVIGGAWTAGFVVRSRRAGARREERRRAERVREQMTPKEKRTLGHADAAVRQARKDIDFLAVLPAQAAQAVLKTYFQAWKNCWDGRADAPTAAGRAMPTTTPPGTSCTCTGWASRSSRLPGGQSSGVRSASSPLPQGKQESPGLSRESTSMQAVGAPGWVARGGERLVSFVPVVGPSAEPACVPAVEAVDLGVAAAASGGGDLRGQGGAGCGGRPAALVAAGPGPVGALGGRCATVSARHRRPPRGGPADGVR
ncbi:hypothetical protein [Streptomyces atratus]|uniref:hypothetical protein n=1 Tax=Streptomyces atratus TaxID=1893 RepID=UPI003FA274E5